jgi:orotate phosphoribosyltransferase
MATEELDDEAVLAEFRAAEALLEGHFILSSDLRSPVYLQCARVLMDPDRADRLCAALAEKVRDLLAEIEEDIDLCVSPAMGGVVVGYEMARQMGCPSIFTERVEGAFMLRRGFEIPKGARCLMVEDVVTTGLSSRECIKAISDHGGRTVAACCLVDRSGGSADVGAPLVPLIGLQAPSFPADQLPPELAAIPAVKPGSRGLKQ